MKMNTRKEEKKRNMEEPIPMQPAKTRGQMEELKEKKKGQAEFEKKNQETETKSLGCSRVLAE